MRYLLYILKYGHIFKTGQLVSGIGMMGNVGDMYTWDKIGALHYATLPTYKHGQPCFTPSFDLTPVGLGPLSPLACKHRLQNHQYSDVTISDGRVNYSAC